MERAVDSRPPARTSDHSMRRCGAVVVGLAVVVSAQVQGDDRLLFQSAAAEPYVMTLLDTSGSMAWALSSPEAAAGDIIPVRGSADDPRSRLYLAKSALFEVVRGLRPGVRLGFAHFRQARFDALRKHWLYTRAPAVRDQDIPWFAELPFPAAGDPIELGRPVVDGDDFELGTCSDPDDARDPNGVSDAAWRINRLNIFPKLGHDGTATTKLYTRRGGETYEVTFSGLPAGELGKDAIQVAVQVRRVNRRCRTEDGYSESAVVTFVPLFTEDDDGVPFTGGFDFFQLHQSGPDVTLSPELHNFNLGEIRDNHDGSSLSSQGSTCEGWEENNNGPTAISYPDAPDPLSRGCANNCLDRGDLLPWDWETYPRDPVDVGFAFSSRNEILRRLAPNIAVSGEFQRDANGDPIPDFRIARYFEDVPAAGQLRLKPQFAGTPPIAVSMFSRTPLASMMEDLGNWFSDWEREASDPDRGDPNFLCREKFVILLTDGVESCGRDPAAAAARLRREGLRVFVVGFGAGVDFGQLQDMADAGGTGQADTDDPNDGRDCEQFEICPGPVTASNRQELITALNRIFGAIEPRPTSFASAAVPQAQAESQESIVLTSFVPVDDQSVWPGALLHFARPLPLTQNDQGLFVPDTGRACDGLDPQVRCLAWDAGQRLLEQAPTPHEAETDLRLGVATNQRRVYYLQENLTAAVPGTKRRFEPATTDFDRFDLWRGMDLVFAPGDLDSESAADDESTAVIKSTLSRKSTADPADPSQTIEYVLGDVFHSDPVVLGSPERFAYFIADLESNDAACDDASDPNPGYRCFFEKHRRRRKVVFAGSNDGQLHAFDAGLFSGRVVDGRLEGEFELGTGHEVFSYIPRLVLPRVRALAQSRQQRFTVDGPAVIDDVFIDPAHSGTPSTEDRQWRTVLVAGLREGGRGYYAVDVTQPDHLAMPPGQDPSLPAQSVPDALGNYVPSCLSTYSGSDCGPLPYPTVLWEFTDGSDEDANATGSFDGADLGLTWSKPNTGRIQVIENGETVVKHVAIFGGGIDPQNLGLVGNWLYMVDFETGRAIYKRRLAGSAPSAPAAVDVDQDSLIDRIYLGTTAGKLYKVDVSRPVALVDTPLGRRIQDPAWAPFEIFDTGERPIFHPPAVIFAAQLSRFALAFGTGYREDLWFSKTPPEEGRFYMIVDDEFTAAQSPRTEAAYQGITLADGPGQDLLLDPSAGTGSEHGWYLSLPPNERVITNAFSVAGVTTFSTFAPDTESLQVGGQATCARAGESNIYSVFTASANGISHDERFRAVEGFVSSPFTEPSATKQSDSEQGPTADDRTDALIEVMMTLRRNFPDNCKFANVTINIKAIRSDTGVEFIAPLPVCVIEKNWREF